MKYKVFPTSDAGVRPICDDFVDNGYVIDIISSWVESLQLSLVLCENPSNLAITCKQRSHTMGALLSLKIDIGSPFSHSCRAHRFNMDRFTRGRRGESVQATRTDEVPHQRTMGQVGSKTNRSSRRPCLDQSKPMSPCRIDSSRFDTNRFSRVRSVHENGWSDR
jgi:hypothetical protein